MFKSYLIKIDNNTIDASKLFDDINKYIAEHGENNYLASIKRKFSGEYLSPSFLNAYDSNPAKALFSSFDTQVGIAATAGSALHKIMEDYYNLPKEIRQRHYLITAAIDQYSNDPEIYERVSNHVHGYQNIDDYLGGKLDDNVLDCETEKKISAVLKINSLNKTTPCEIKCVVDRIDYRDDKIYILDYKTGTVNKTSAKSGAYMTQLVMYKWAVETLLGKDVESAFLLEPKRGMYSECKFDLNKETEVYDKLLDVYNSLKLTNLTRLYKFNDTHSFTDNEKLFSNIMKEKSSNIRIPVELCLN